LVSVCAASGAQRDSVITKTSSSFIFVSSGKINRRLHG
jgi:hypothetical protein